MYSEFPIDLIHKRSNFKIFFSAIFFLVSNLFIGAQFVSSETLPYCGIDFKVGRIVNIDQGNFRVQIGQDDQIVSQDSLRHWVAERTLSNPALLNLLPGNQLLLFIDQCLEAESQDLLAIVLKAVLLRAENLSFQHFMQDKPKAQDLVKAVLVDDIWESIVRTSKDSIKLENLINIISELFILDSKWIKFSIPKLFYLLNLPIFHKLSDRSEQELSQANKRFFDDLSSALLNFADNRSKEFVLLEEQVLISKALLKSELNYAEMEVVKKKLEGSPQELEYIIPFYIQRVVHEVTLHLQNAALKQASETAILLLPSRRSPDSIEVLSKLISNLRQHPENFVEQKLDHLLKAYSVDQAFKKQYADCLEMQFKYYFEKSDSDKSEKIFNYLVGLRPDPNSRNNDLRLKLIALLKSNGKGQKATSLMAELPSEFSIWKMLISGNWFSFVMSSFLLFVLLSSLTWLLYRRGLFDSLGSLISGFVSKARIAIPSKQKAERDRIDHERDAANRASAFVKLDRMRAVSPMRIEYEQKMAIFGLDGQASLKSLKTAYRSAVKECHPDLNPNQSKEMTARFSDLTKSYEELIEIRKQLGILDV